MGSLTPVASADAFIDAIEKSGLLSAEALAKVREAAAATSDPRALARDLVKAGTLTKWQAGQLLHGYYLLMVGKFKLLDQIEVGEMGRLYQAEHAQMGRKHTLKILSRRHTARPDVLKRFLEDAQKVCGLEHRNLSHIYDVNQDGEKYYVVMEHLEGQDLQKLVEKSGKLPAAEALAYVRQAAEGLAYAQESGIIHGDLKPANLSLEPDGVIKILNIGQARLAEAPAGSGYEESIELPARAAGEFQSPEQRASIPTVDERSDIYSLGSILCFLVSGKAPKNAGEAGKLLGGMKEVPAELTALCQKLMARTPADRPQKLSEVLESLAAVSAKADVPAAKAEKAEAEKPAMPPLPKAKKPPVAKALPGSPPMAKPLEEEAAAGPIKIKTGSDSSEEAAPFAGLAIKPAEKGAKPAKPPVAGGVNIKHSAASAKATPAKAAPAKAGAKSAGGKSYLPYILAGVIGGGLLALGGIAFAIYLAISWGMGQAEKLVADAAEAVEAAAVEEPVEPEPMAMPEEANPEANPEVNPVVEPTPPAEATPPAPSATPPATAATEPAKTEPPKPEPAKPEPATPEPTKTEPPKPEPAKPEPAKPEPPKTEPPKPAPPKPAAPKPKPANPFVNLPKTAGLPKIDPMAAQAPPPEALSAVLGPHTVGDKDLMIVYLIGGEGAIKGGRQKFELAAAASGTAERDWEISLTGGEAPVVIALVSAKDKQLTFQWTEAGAKQPSAPLLCNCYLELGMGDAKHDLALRTPIQGQPMQVEIEKRASVKWTIEHLPDPKKVYIEVTRLEGAFNKHKFDPAPNFEGSSGMTIWTGNEDASLPLAIKLDGAVSARQVSVGSSAQFKLGSMKEPEIYSKKNMASANQMIVGGQRALTSKIQALGKSRDEKVAKERAALTELVNEADVASKQLAELQGIAQSLQGAALIHFRVYYDTGSTPVELLTTGGEPAKK